MRAMKDIVLSIPEMSDEGFWVFIVVSFIFPALWLANGWSLSQTDLFFRFLFVFSAPVFFSGLGFFTGFHCVRRARLIEDVPTAKVRSAHQGYLELEGKVIRMPDIKLVAPLSKRECCWYRYSISTTGKNSSVIESGSSDAYFQLEDDTGRCLIDPDQAEVTSLHTTGWYGNTRYPEEVTPPVETPKSFFGFQVVTGSYHYQEEYLLEDDPLYAIGYFQSFDDSIRKENEARLTREILGEWKQNQATLLARFDRNYDGNIDAKEWEHAQRVAARKASERAAEFLETHSHKLSRSPIRDQRYLLSNIPQSVLVDRYRQRSWVSFTLFFYSGVISAIVVAKYF